jgi:AcrR family transcriptional regulator
VTGTDGTGRGAGPGRPRDATIDAAILAAAQRALAHAGYEAMSLAAIAAEAGTTRQALYRRYATKADLATAAVAALAPVSDGAETDDPFADLVAELEAFVALAEPIDLSLAGTMLQGTVDEELVELYRQRVVRPQADRLVDLLARARRSGVVDHDADVELAALQVVGSWLALGLAGEVPPVDWPRRVATLVWRSLGGPRRAPGTGPATA